MRIGADETPLTLKDVLERHGGEVWSQADRPRQKAWFRFLLPLGEPVATAAPRPAATDNRPEYYDFDLFERIETTGALAERRLAELSYTVFDTETTGLEPSAGDEIISIGAVRIVNGRLLKNEVFEQLVNPLRPDCARCDAHPRHRQPGARRPAADRRRSCPDSTASARTRCWSPTTRRSTCASSSSRRPTTGVRFGQPVLDTLLLSAVVHPSFENHHLDTIAERLGVRVIGRHTALGRRAGDRRGVPEAAAACLPTAAS